MSLTSIFHVYSLHKQKGIPRERFRSRIAWRRRLSSCFPALSFSSSFCDCKSKIHSDVSPCLIYISRYFILQFDRIFFNLIYTPSINWSRILGSEGVSAVVGEEMGREDEFRIQQFEMDFRITFHDVSFNALSIIYQKCISSFISYIWFVLCAVRVRA